METLKKLFPLSWKYTKDAGNLIIGILIYLVVGILAGVAIAVAALLTGLSIAGFLFALVLRIVGALVDIYIIAGIVIQILVFAKVIKD